MDKVRDQIVIALMLVCIYLIAANISMLATIDKMQKEQEKQKARIASCEGRMHAYEKRTTDALNNWDSMRKTQLVLMDLLQNRN